ncbi:P63C domain-containing protein [Flavobacterium sp. RHBU_24]|uniref:P63C domain-containing protein n=1 Tax=Flavobacterium sp. RHBU_24 TaxID=3391185 RepID=UPI0039848A3B
MKKILKATHQGELPINGFLISCAVLENGERVLVNRSLATAFGLKGSGAYWKNKKDKKNTALPEYLSAKYLQPFIDEETKSKLYNTISYINSSGTETEGVDATFLSDICNIYVKAGQKGVFKDNPEIPEKAYNLLVALSKVAITALVDEVTGYQDVRAKDALQVFLIKFLEEEKGKWIKTFPDEFFETIFRMRGLTWSLANKGKKPQYIGHYINNFVYSRIAPQVLNELRKINPKDENGNRKGKHPQYIDVDFGHPKLKEHLNILIALAKASGYNWTNWTRLVERALPKFEQDGSQLLSLPFSDPD